MNNLKKMADSLKDQERKIRKMKETISYASVEAYSDNLEILLLPVRAENALRGEGIDSLKKLVGCSENGLRKFPNLGRKTLPEIIAIMREHNLYLLG